jgi:PPP family 3-phenylpropionic acid transporter
MIARLRWFYFLAYAGVGTWLSYFAPYLRGLGFSGEEIGAVSMAQQLVVVPAALIWGLVGDRQGAPVRALRLCAAGAAVTVLGIPLARTPLQMGVVLVLATAFSGGIVPLVDSTTVQALQGGYARTRLFGSLGFVVSAPALGFLLTLRGERPADVAMPLAYILCVVTYALLAQTFALQAAAFAQSGEPWEPRGDPPSAPIGAGEPPALGSHWREAAALLRSRPLLFVLAICALHWGALGPYHLLFGVLVREQGLSSAVTGLGMALGVVAEIFALMAFPRLEERFSLRALFLAASLGTALRWAMLARAHGAVALVSLQLLHALSFGIWWGCAVEAMQRVVPARLRATGQALFSAVVFGAGNAAGYALSGAGYDRFGRVAPLYSCAAAVELLPILLLLLPLAPERGRA